MSLDFKQTFEQFIFEWNIQFPLDKAYRQKHGISFGSHEHLKLSQVALYLDHLENRMYEEFLRDAEKQIEADKKKEEEAKKGNFIKEPESKFSEDELFEKLKNNFSMIE